MSEESPLDNSMIVNSDYSDTLRSMRSALTYTEKPTDIMSEIDEKCKASRLFHPNDFASDPTKFSYHILGIKPFWYQYQFFEIMRDGCKKFIMISARQLGKSTMLAIFALWAAYYNVYPSGIYRNTKINIISRGDQQATDILSNIKRLIEEGDRKFAIRTNGTVNEVISCELADNQPQTASQITFKNGSVIRSFPPTDRVRGSTSDILIVDECAYIEEDLFFKILEPTTNAVRGAVIMTSTPNGMSGLGYTIFDPMNDKATNPYKRMWIPWWMCEDANQQKDIEEKKEQWIANGKIKDFQQEYEAKFTVSETSFFDSEKVDQGVDDRLSYVNDWHTEPCCMGVDYGWKSSRSAIVIVSKSKDGILRTRFAHAYPTDGSDLNMFNDIIRLTKLFDIQWVIPDDCSMGYQINQKLTNIGLPIKPFNFRSDQNAGERNRGYYMLRSALYNGRIKLVKDGDMLSEMKMLVESKKAINVTIKAPEGERCDLADALCMACYSFLNEDDDDGVLAASDVLTESNIKNKDYSMFRRDNVWAGLNGEEEKEELENEETED